MAQSEQDLYREIVKEYKAAVKEDSRIEALKKRLESDKATTAAAWDYGDAAGSNLEKAFLEKAKEIVDSEDGYNAVKKALKAGYDDVSDYTADVLSGQNKKAGIGMKGIPADFDDVKSTASALSNKISNAESVEGCEEIIRQEVKTFTNNAVGDTIRETARMSESQGMSPKIERSASSTACQYCLGLAGSYIYPCDREVFTRHANCDCVVEYQPVKGARKIVSSSTVKQNKGSLSPEERERRAEKRLKDNEGSFTTFDLRTGTYDHVKPRNVINDLRKSEVGNNTLRVIRDKGLNVKLYYGADNPDNLYGEFDGENIIVYADYTKTVHETALTVVHEAKHAEIDKPNTKDQELECFIAEMRHDNKNIDHEAIENLKAYIDATYPDLSWED